MGDIPGNQPQVPVAVAAQEPLESSKAPSRQQQSLRTVILSDIPRMYVVHSYEVGAISLLWAVLLGLLPPYLGAAKDSFVTIACTSLEAALLGISITSIGLTIRQSIKDTELARHFNYIWTEIELSAVFIFLFLSLKGPRGFYDVIPVFLLGVTWTQMIWNISWVIRFMSTKPKSQHTAEQKAANRKKNAGLVLGSVIAIASLLAAIFQVIPPLLALFK